MKVLSIILGVALLGSITAHAQYKLQYKVSNSGLLHYSAHSTMQQTESMMGQEAKVSAISDESISVASENAAGELVFDMKVDSSKNTVIMPNGDTTNTPSPVVGKVREIRIHPDGEEISSRWLDTTFASAPAGQMREFTSFFFRLPTKEVSAGSTWNDNKTDTVSTPTGGGKILVNTNTDYTLVDQEKVAGITCAKINFTGKVTLDGSTQAQGVDLKINGKGSISGTAMFDYANGRIVRIAGNSNQDVTMTPTGQNGNSIPMTQVATYDLTLVK